MSNSEQHFEHHVCVDTAIDPDNVQANLPTDQSLPVAVELLARTSGLSKNQIKQAMSKGAVWLSRNDNVQRVRRAKKLLQRGDTLHLYYNKKILVQQPPPAVLIADESAYSIWYKPYGMFCQGSKWGDHCTIQRWVENALQRPTWLVHRLDRATKGLMILAHDKQCAQKIATLFRHRKIQKHYRARVHGQFPQQTQPQTISEAIDGRAAVSHVKLIAVNITDNQSLVEIKIDTGRKHQIRQHMAIIGYPIVGDRLYGVGNDSVDLQLCSWSLEFYCPVFDLKKHYSLITSQLTDTIAFAS